MKYFGNEKGFYLIEVVTVIIIIAILATVAYPRFKRWNDQSDIEAEARRVYYDLLMAKTTAYKNKNNVIVTFSPQRNSYKIHDDTNNNGRWDIGEVVKNIQLGDTLRFGIAPGIRDLEDRPLSQPLVMGGGKEVIFDNQGMANLNGSLYLIPSDDFGKTGDRMHAISINQSQGPDIKRYNPNPPAGAIGPWE